MSETSLAQLQRDFLARMRGGDGSLAHAVAPGRMPAGVGLRIYAHAYAARLREALEHDHPALGRYLGDQRWDAMCTGYIAAHPSQHRSLRDFGNQLPHFLDSTAPFSAHPELAELASFERALLDSFDAADAPLAAWQDLLALPPEHWPTLAPTFHPSLHVCTFTHNIVELWRVLKLEQTPPSLQRADAAWALWRDDQRIGRFRSLESSEAAALVHLRQGGNFASLCEQLAHTLAPDTVPAFALGLLQTWCAERWIARWA